MNKLCAFVFPIVLSLAACSHEEHAAAPATPAAATTPAVAAAQTLEVGCATCVFKMEGVEGCVLAAKLDGKTHLVTGVDMPGHDSGLCDHSRQAELAGALQGEKFVATSMALKP